MRAAPGGAGQPHSLPAPRGLAPHVLAAIQTAGPARPAVPIRGTGARHGTASSAQAYVAGTAPLSRSARAPHGQSFGVVQKADVPDWGKAEREGAPPVAVAASQPFPEGTLSIKLSAGHKKKDGNYSRMAEIEFMPRPGGRDIQRIELVQVVRNVTASGKPVQTRDWEEIEKWRTEDNFHLDRLPSTLRDNPYQRMTLDRSYSLAYNATIARLRQEQQEAEILRAEEEPGSRKKGRPKKTVLWDFPGVPESTEANVTYTFETAAIEDGDPTKILGVVRWEFELQYDYMFVGYTGSPAPTITFSQQASKDFTGSIHQFQHAVGGGEPSAPVVKQDEWDAWGPAPDASQEAPQPPTTETPPATPSEEAVESWEELI